MEKQISIIGGDLRIVKLIEMLEKDGYTIYAFGLEKTEALINKENIVMCENIQDAINASRVVIGPIPLSSNNQDINTPFSNNTITMEEMFLNMSNKIFIAGSISKKAIELSENKNIQVFDLLNREELAVLNTISTAEGAIQIAMQETLSTIHGSNVLVMGFGRIGKILSKMLSGIGAKVSCEARKEADLAWIKAYGYESIHLNELKDNLNKFDIIINTIPYTILDSEKLDCVKEDCVIIDLASNPGGVDKVAAKQKGIKTIWALSLPGKVAPLTSAEFIKETIYNILKEIK